MLVLEADPPVYRRTLSPRLYWLPWGQPASPLLLARHPRSIFLSRPAGPHLCFLRRCLKRNSNRLVLWTWPFPAFLSVLRCKVIHQLEIRKLGTADPDALRNAGFENSGRPMFSLHPVGMSKCVHVRVLEI